MTFDENLSSFAKMDMIPGNLFGSLKSHLIFRNSFDFLKSHVEYHMEWCHISKILEMLPHLLWEMPRLQLETRHPHSRDAIIHHWRCKISFRDAHPPHPHLHLSSEMPHLPREMWWHLQNLGYVTLL
jgi:hypothetical protein